ncbi:hypothetical protein B7H23_01270 [Notoacmeibacter marinus]|uniref:Uncharacterized protein n=1 Tax=Notoacmeibacter marinus TaxID=1876515 RepID=A0A231V0H4_9HYPH|nr:hypothetical protein [Notoacmeibacter marinus]OXT01630.1 hypothetical protein B7H23_01270 [Notoacmeibacter marinus]
MTRRPSSLGAIIGINARLFWAFSLCVIAWFTWPTSMKWWGFGIISVCAALSALGLLIEAIRAASKLYLRDKALAEFEAQGAKPKTARVAGDDSLEKAGMR